MNQQLQTTTLTPDELNQLFNIGKSIDKTQQEALKMYSLATVYQDALMFNHENGMDFFPEVYSGIAELFVSGMNTIKQSITNANDNHSSLYNKKRSEVYCNE